jgi:hypothetical protein
MNDRQKYRNGFAIAAKMRSGGPMRNKHKRQSSKEYLEEVEMDYVYAFVYNGDENWKASSIDDWDFDNVELNGTERIVGHRKFDGSICRICQDDSGKVIAVIN